MRKESIGLGVEIKRKKYLGFMSTKRNRFYEAFNADTLRYDVIDRKSHKIVRTFDKKYGAMMWSLMLNNRE